MELNVWENFHFQHGWSVDSHHNTPLGYFTRPSHHPLGVGLLAATPPCLSHWPLTEPMPKKVIKRRFTQEIKCLRVCYHLGKERKENHEKLTYHTCLHVHTLSLGKYLRSRWCGFLFPGKHLHGRRTGVRGKLPWHSTPFCTFWIVYGELENINE